MLLELLCVPLGGTLKGERVGTVICHGIAFGILLQCCTPYGFTCIFIKSLARQLEYACGCRANRTVGIAEFVDTGVGKYNALRNGRN